MSWNPAPDEGQIGTVHLATGEWAYRYEIDGELIIMKKPESADAPPEPSTE